MLGDENSTNFGDWWENPDRVEEPGCPFQEIAEPAGSDPMHARSGGVCRVSKCLDS